MTPDELITRIRIQPESIAFPEVIATIEANYSYTPTRFSNGIGDSTVVNEAGQNEGSCKIFAFARLHNLDKEETLACFGAYYRDDVLQHPQATDHVNIRHFMMYGWDGIRFDGEALKPSTSNA